MATVEEIYRKIRQGNRQALNYDRPTGEDLSGGVERIRKKLQMSDIRSSKTGDFFLGMRVRLQGLLRPRVLAPLSVAMILLAMLPMFRRKPIQAPPPAGWFIESRPLTVTTNEPLASGDTLVQPGKFQLKAMTDSIVRVAPLKDTVHRVFLLYGIALIHRVDPDFQIIVHANRHTYKLTGTQFILQSSPSSEALFLIDGSVEFSDETGKHHSISGKNNLLLYRKGKAEINNATLSQLAEIIPEAKDSLRHFSSQTAFAEKTTVTGRHQAKAAFRSGDCVIYYRNNEKHRGKIHGHADRGYTIHGDSGPEPGFFSEKSLFRRACGE